MGARYRSSNSGILILFLFGGFELAQAIGNHQPSLAFGTWLALSAAGSLALRTPTIRWWLAERSLTVAAVVAVELMFASLMVVALLVVVLGIDRNDLVWVVAAAVGLVLTPFALRAFTLPPAPPNGGTGTAGADQRGSGGAA